MRVLADSYRVRPNPYEQSDDDPPPWQRYGEVRKRVKDFADASWGDDSREQLERALAALSFAGHENGTIRMSRLAFRLVTSEDLYFRCDACGRVHLHRGTTRSASFSVAGIRSAASAPGSFLLNACSGSSA